MQTAFFQVYGCMMYVSEEKKTFSLPVWIFLFPKESISPATFSISFPTFFTVHVCVCVRLYMSVLVCVFVCTVCVCKDMCVCVFSAV